MEIIGHRGAAGLEPENTMRSFRRALECGVSYLECDVWKVENQLIVFHDRELDRCTNGSGLLSASSLAALQALDAGEGEQIPLLSAVCELALGRAKMNIELKGPDTAAAVGALIAGYVHAGRARWSDYLVISFDHRQLRTLRALYPEIPIGVLWYGIPEDLTAPAQELGAVSVHLALDFIDQSMVQEAKRSGLKVFVYTVNEPRDMELVTALGVDGFATDFPDRCCTPS